MGIWRQTSLFTYKNGLSLENIIPSFKYMGEPTSASLVQKHIERYSKEGDVVLDPCCGNGTTGVIAMSLHRRSVMSDLNALAVRTVHALFDPCDEEEMLVQSKEIVRKASAVHAEHAMHAIDSAVKEIASALGVNPFGQQEAVRGEPRSERKGQPVPGEEEAGRLPDGMYDPGKVTEERRGLLPMVNGSGPAKAGHAAEGDAEGPGLGTASFLREWETLMRGELPPYTAFRRIVSRQAGQIGELFHPHDLLQLQVIHAGIQAVQEKCIRDLLTIVFCHTLLESSQLVRSHRRMTVSLTPRPAPRRALERFREDLEFFLGYRRVMRENLLAQGTEAPKVAQATVRRMEYLPAKSVDYICFELPQLEAVREGEWSYLAELFLEQRTDIQEELVIRLDYRGRHRLVRDLKEALAGLERVLKENAYLTCFFPGHYVLLSLIISVAQDEGWQLVEGNVEVVKRGRKEEYPLMSLTLQKRSRHAVLGALNKMKTETLYDTEEAIIRKIDHFLTEGGAATTWEIQQFLIERYLHDCLIEKPLENILAENYPGSGGYWLRPSAEQREELLQKRTAVMEEVFPAFVAEMVYTFLRDEGTALHYDELAKRLLQLRPRGIFHTPYYRLLIEQCDRRGAKLQSILDAYLQNEKRDPFETPAAVIRRMVRNEPAFVELIPGEWLGLEEWSGEDFFKVYLELYERAKRKKEKQLTGTIGKKVLELLPAVSYLDERKKERIREYIVRSEGV